MQFVFVGKAVAALWGHGAYLREQQTSNITVFIISDGLKGTLVGTDSLFEGFEKATYIVKSKYYILCHLPNVQQIHIVQELFV